MICKERCIIEIAKFQKELYDWNYRKEDFLSSGELNFYPQKKNEIRFCAGRYAVKNSVINSLRKIEDKEFDHREMTIINDEMKRPIITFSGRMKEFIERYKIEDISISISHSKDWVIGIVASRDLK